MKKLSFWGAYNKLPSDEKLQVRDQLMVLFKIKDIPNIYKRLKNDNAPKSEIKETIDDIFHNYNIEISWK